MIIPENVTSFFDGTVFLNCDLLRDVFYLPATSPSNWYAASNTYVPTLDSYNIPSYSGNGAIIKEYISFTSKEFTYTGEIPNVEWVNNVTGYEAEVDLSNIKKEVGVYNEKIPIKLTKGDYVIEAYVIFKYTIKAAPLLVTVNDASRVYGDENPQFTYTISGFINGDDFSILSSNPNISTTATKKSDVGTYNITASGCTAPNYSITYKPGILTVTKRTLSVSVGNYARDYNSENPEFTLDYTGFVNDDDLRVIDTKPYAYTSANKDSNVGTYTINLTGGEDNNYNFYYNSGELTINKAEQDLIWNQDLNKLAIGEQVKLLAEATSGLEITYSLDQNEICELYSIGKSVYLDCKSEGEIQISALQEGNGNYYATPRITKKIIISSGDLEKPSLTIKQADIGSISTKVERGSVYEFTITPEENWLIHSVSFNGNDYTNELDKTNTFTTPKITNNSTITIVYSQAPSGISHNEMSTIRITGTQNGIKVNDANFGTEVYIYTIDGRLIKSQEIKSSSEEIKLENKRLYIIKIGTFTYKLRL